MLLHSLKLIKISSFFIIYFILTGCASMVSSRTIPMGKNYKSYMPPEEIPEDIEDDLISKKTIRTNSKQLTLDEVLSLTLLNNPKLKIAAWDIKSKNALVQQAKLWNNPELELGLENFGTKTYSINLSQKIELGGKRASRIALAKAENDISLWDYEVKRLELIINAGKQFLNSLEIQKKVALLNNSIKLAENSLKLTKVRYKAGVGTMIDVIRAEKDSDFIELKHRKELKNLKLQYKILASFWGDKKYYFNNVMGDFLLPESIPDFNNLVSKLTNNPDLARWVFEFEGRKYESQNAKAQRIPDLNINAGYEREVDTSENIIGLGLSFNLPIFNRNQGSIESAKVNLHKMKYLKEHIELMILNDLSDAYTRLQNNSDEAKILKYKTLTGLNNAFDEAKKFYEMGKITALELLSLQNELIEAEIKFIEVLSEFYKAKYDIELLIGDEIKVKYDGEMK